MKPDNDKRLNALLARGYFPEELPPPFEAKSFAEAVMASPAEYSAAVSKTDKKPTVYGRHNLARNGRLKRVLAILNPREMYSLSRLIVENWREIDTLIRKSPLTRTAPVWNFQDGRALERATSLDDRPRARAKVHRASRILLQADVERFFPSIYTHSIPWAILGKDEAKRLYAAGKLTGTLGDKLDIAVRRGQGNQTIGIPIGPDTSRVISELILSRADISLPKKVSSHAMRFLDDYEFSCESTDVASGVYVAFHEALATLELHPNPRKTHVIELPTQLESTWLGPLRSFDLRASGNVKDQYFRLQQYLDTAVDLAEKNSEDSVLKWAAAKLASVAKIYEENWRFVFDRCCGISVADPGALPPMLSLIQRMKNAGLPIDRGALARAMNVILQREGGLRHSSFVAWALWACIVFELKVNKASISKIQEIDDSVVALLTLHARKLKLLPTGTRFANWQRAMSETSLNHEMWLLAYEAPVKGWFRPKKDHIKGHPVFSLLRSKGVEFYDLNALAKWREKQTKPGRIPTTAELY